MTIFIGGAHGAGKTFVAKPTADRLGLRYATASQLIREERGRASWGTGKVVAEVDENQRALVAAVRRIAANRETLLLDGHFVLRVAPNQHQRLPVEVFANLSCSAIVVIRCPADVISERLLQRGDHSWPVEELVHFGTAEAEHGAAVAATLNIPFEALDSPSPQDFETCLRALGLGHRNATPGNP